MKPIRERLQALGPGALHGIRRGIEKESLRVRPDGTLAATPHPAGLGSALAHPHITTDFSEAQLELITGVHAGVESCLEELTSIHQAVYRQIGDELLWCASMPCTLPADDAIPIGRYGSSNVGQAKTVYRTGLSHRYGRRMQTISGIHYNFSLPGVSNEAYFALIRNFRRHSWLLLYLFGASPAVCASFVAGREHDLETLTPGTLAPGTLAPGTLAPGTLAPGTLTPGTLKAGTLHRPWATSLRMGRLGYQSDAQAALAVSYNSLESYGASLQDALTHPWPPYAAIGVRAGGDAGGEYRQLATSLLQIENEFYGTIRPKRIVRPGERPLHALRSRGVEYVEARLMDLDPFCPVGIAAGTMRFLDVFLLHCLLAESQPDSPAEISALARNQHRVAAYGREPGLTLVRGGQDVALFEWGGQLLVECEPIAAALDAAHGVTLYREALSAGVAALGDSESLPSARMLRAIRESFDGSFLRFGLAHSARHRRALEALPLAAEVEQRFARLAEESVAEQRRIEAADDVPFETYRQRYLALDRLGV